MADSARRRPVTKAGARSWFLEPLLGVLTSIGGYAEVASISTSVQGGAAFGLRLVWPLLVGTVGLILLTEMVGRWASVAGTSYAGAIREHFGFGFYLIPLGAEVVADTLLLAAELGGMAAGLALLTGLPLRVGFVVAAVTAWAGVWYLTFPQIERGPGLIGLLSLAFVPAIGVALVRPAAHLPLRTLLQVASVPGGSTGRYLFLCSAVLGATLSPYLVVFYASGAREEGWTRDSLSLNRLTATLGIGLGGVVGVSVIALSAIVLGPAHTNVSTLAAAAQILEGPLGTAGRLLFGAILLVCCFGAALEVCLAVSFDVAQGFGWSWDASAPHSTTVRFRLVILAVLAVATAVGLIAGDPLTLALVASAVMALILPASLGPFLVIMNDRRHLGPHANGPVGNAVVVTVLVLAALISLATIPLLVFGGG